MKRITINLLDEEYEALLKVAKIERRETRHQAAYVIRYGLHHMGILEGEFSPLIKNGSQATQKVAN